MIKVVKMGRRGITKMPDTFAAFIAQSGSGNQLVDLHFGSNFDVVVVTMHSKVLSRDNQERIRILTDVK